jgi:ferritin-like metal-binding protein YciE
MMFMKDLRELFIEELADIYSAEQQLVKALPKMAKAASSEELREGIERHLEQTEEHVSRIEQVFEIFGEKAKAKKCEAMAGLIREAQEALEEDAEGAVKDALLIACAQKVEHYEIASYGTLRTWAEVLEEEDAVALLEDTENEEKETDDTLTDLAETINSEANMGEEEMEEEEEGEESSRRSMRPKGSKK